MTLLGPHGQGNGGSRVLLTLAPGDLWADRTSQFNKGLGNRVLDAGENDCTKRVEFWLHLCQAALDVAVALQPAPADGVFQLGAHYTQEVLIIAVYVAYIAIVPNGEIDASLLSLCV